MSKILRRTVLGAPIWLLLLVFFTTSALAIAFAVLAIPANITLNAAEGVTLAYPSGDWTCSIGNNLGGSVGSCLTVGDQLTAVFNLVDDEELPAIDRQVRNDSSFSICLSYTGGTDTGITVTDGSDSPLAAGGVGFMSFSWDVSGMTAGQAGAPDLQIEWVECP